MQDMQKAMVTQKRLEGVLGDAETLGTMVEEVQHLPITEMRVSDEMRKVS